MNTPYVQNAVALTVTPSTKITPTALSVTLTNKQETKMKALKAPKRSDLLASLMTGLLVVTLILENGASRPKSAKTWAIRFDSIAANRVTEPTYLTTRGRRLPRSYAYLTRNLEYLETSKQVDWYLKTNAKLTVSG